MDISESLAPASEQLDAIELVGGPRTFTIERVSAGSADQPVNVYLVDFSRPWRPSKNMRRVLAACWSTDASTWTGRRVELFFDPDVTFGKDTPGGTRISKLSHIDKPKSVPLLISRGKSAMYRVEPLPDTEPASPIVSTETLAELASMFRRKGIPEDKWLAGANHVTKGAAMALDAITEDQARKVLAELRKRPDVEPDPGEAELFGGEGT